MEKDEDGNPALATMVFAAKAKYKTTAAQEYLVTAANNNANCYRIPANNEPADNDEEPAKETKDDEPFDVACLGYGETVKARKVNDLAAAATNEDAVACAQMRASDAAAKEDLVAFA